MHAIVQALAARGHEIDVLLPQHAGFVAPDEGVARFVAYRYSPSERWTPFGFGQTVDGASKIRPRVLPLLPVVVVAFRMQIARLLRAHRYDILHAHWVVPNGWLAARPVQRHEVPLVVSLHGSDVSLAERHAVLARMATTTFAAASAVTAASDDLARRAVALGADRFSTHTVRYGVDCDLFAPRFRDPGLRERLGVGDGAFLVVSVGRLVEVKGFRYLIEAACRVEGIHVAIVGSGDLRADLESEATCLRAPVTFVGDLRHDLVAEVLGAADAVAVPSVVDSRGRVDGLPNTLVEALSAGRPVVASAVGGIPEVVTDTANGLLVPEKDVDALARALSKLSSDAELRNRLGKEARRRAVRDLGWDATAEAFERVYAAARAPRDGGGS